MSQVGNLVRTYTCRIKVTSHLSGYDLREKIRTRASFNKTPTNYISEESLINVVYDKNTS